MPIEEERESPYSVRFLQPEDVAMYDSDGNVILCKCGNPAGYSAMGVNSFVAWCDDCSPLPKYGASMVYRTGGV